MDGPGVMQLEIVWESTEQQQKSTDKIEFVLKGCKCRTGCNSRRCKCIRRMKGFVALVVSV